MTAALCTERERRGPLPTPATVRDGLRGRRKAAILRPAAPGSFACPISWDNSDISGVAERSWDTESERPAVSMSITVGNNVLGGDPS